MKSLKICIIHSSIFTPKMPARPEITEIYGKYLPKMGHEVTWICGSNKRRICKRVYDNLNIITIPSSEKNSLFVNPVDYIKYYSNQIKILKKIKKQKKFDIVQVRNDYTSVIIVKYIFRDKIPLVFQYSFPTYYSYKQNWLFSLLNLKDDLMIKYISNFYDYIFPISKWMKRELVQKGISKLKMEPIPMGVNPKLFSPKESGEEIILKYSLKNLNIISYIGTMSENRVQALKKLIYSFKKILTIKPKTVLLMVGEGDGKKNLINISKRLGINNKIIFTGQVPYSRVPEYIGASEVILSLIPNLPIYKVSSPTKLVEGMAVGKPVIANKEIFDHKEVIKKSGGGILVDLDSESILNGILYLLHNPKVRKKMGEKGRRWVVKNRSYYKLSKKIEKTYYRLLRNTLGV